MNCTFSFTFVFEFEQEKVPTVIQPLIKIDDFVNLYITVNRVYVIL